MEKKVKKPLGGNLPPLLPDEDNGNSNIIKNRLKVILAEKGISQTELADKVGISKTTLSNIVNGYQNCTLPVALDIAKVLNTPVERIFYKDFENKDAVESFKKMINEFNELYDLYSRSVLNEDILRILYSRHKNNFIDEFGIEAFDFISSDLMESYKDNRVAFEILLLK